jgi:hypothetical protein
VLGERLTPLQVGLCFALIASGVAVALGSHEVREIEIDIPRGAALTVLAALLMVCAVFGVKRLARDTHPLLTAWAWEFGSGHRRAGARGRVTASRSRSGARGRGVLIGVAAFIGLPQCSSIAPVPYVIG